MTTSEPPSTLRYAARRPVTYLFRDVDQNGGPKRTKAKHFLWGDWVWIEGPDDRTDWLKVKYGRRRYFMRKEDVQEKRLLEIIFLDVGQGDGCIVTEPGYEKPRVLVVDAGAGANMARFLDWRFRDFNEVTPRLHAAVITHPDKDHYYGFSGLFDSSSSIRIDNIYHNGIIERDGDDKLGPARSGYLVDIHATNRSVARLLSDPKIRGDRLYPNLIKKAIDAKHIGDIRALTTAHGTIECDKTWMPGLAPSARQGLTVEVLGPVVELHDERPCLRRFGSSPTSRTMNVGKTKNGHSVLLLHQYGAFRVLLGGDLNRAAEPFLLLWYGANGSVPPPLSGRNNDWNGTRAKSVITKAQARFGVDLMKTCHHGSADVTEEFLHATMRARV